MPPRVYHPSGVEVHAIPAQKKTGHHNEEVRRSELISRRESFTTTLASNIIPPNIRSNKFTFSFSASILSNGWNAS